MLTVPYRIAHRTTSEEGTVEDIITQVVPMDDGSMQSLCFLVVAWDETDDDSGNPRAPFEVIPNTPEYINLGMVDMSDDEDDEPSEEGDDGSQISDD
jgi:hypothetical protein